MTTELSDAVEKPQTLRVEGYEVVLHIRDKKGRVKDLMFLDVLFLLISPDAKVHGAITLHGVHYDVPIRDAAGAVIWGDQIYQSAGAYYDWARQNMH